MSGKHSAEIYLSKNKKISFKQFSNGSFKFLIQRSYYFSPATVTLEALSTKTVIQVAIALVKVMLLARNVTSVLASTMDYLFKDVR